MAHRHLEHEPIASFGFLNPAVLLLHVRVRRAETFRLVINPIIYAEVSNRYSGIEDLNEALPKELVAREALPYEAAFLAGKAFLLYRQRSGSRRSPLPDFFIGAHASIAGYSLLTRDAARYRSYFPRLPLIAPS
jgi:predicted nucleic acid-binding protein